MGKCDSEHRRARTPAATDYRHHGAAPSRRRVRRLRQQADQLHFLGRHVQHPLRADGDGRLELGRARWAVCDQENPAATWQPEVATATRCSCIQQHHRRTEPGPTARRPLGMDHPQRGGRGDPINLAAQAGIVQ